MTLFCRLFNIVLIPFDWSFPKEISTFSGKLLAVIAVILFTSSIVLIIFSPILLETSIVIELDPFTFA